jgi:hypothetical protein
METLKKIVSNQYFPAAAVLTAVVLFWAVGLLGGLSLLNNNQPPLTTLTWMLFVYVAAVLTPLAGILAAVDLVRRWKRNRAAEIAVDAYGEARAAEAEFMAEEADAPEPALIQGRPEHAAIQERPEPAPIQERPAQQPTQQKRPEQQQKPIQKKSGPRKAA